jgi:type IV pilus assembly protein PilY1
MIPPGATITEAYIEIPSAYNGSTNTCNVTIAAHDADSQTAAPANRDTQLGWARTTATVAWNDIEDWTQDTIYNTPDIKTIIQEIIDRPGWAEGNGIMFLFTDNNSNNSAGRAFYGSNVSHKTPRLFVKWTHPTKWVGIAKSGTTDDNAGYSNGTDVFSQAQPLWLRDSSKNRHPFWRFPSCNIPKGATITACTLRIWSSSAQTPSGWVAKLYFNAADDAAAPTSAAEFAGLAKTTSYLEWTPQNPAAANTPYDITGAGLIAALQEVIDRAGYAEGNDVQIIGDSNMGTNGQGFSCIPFSDTLADGNHAFEAQQSLLLVEFTEPVSGGNKIMMVS